MDCEICNRVKVKDLVFFEDDNVVACLAHNQVTLGKSSVYYKKHVTSFTSLNETDRNALMDSVVRVGFLLEKTFKPLHMNYSLLGNYFPHLHWHLIPRYDDKSKDNYFFNSGLEYPILGRMISGRYELKREALLALVDKIKKNI